MAQVKRVNINNSCKVNSICSLVSLAVCMFFLFCFFEFSEKMDRIFERLARPTSPFPVCIRRAYNLAKRSRSYENVCFQTQRHGPERGGD